MNTIKKKNLFARYLRFENISEGEIIPDKPLNSQSLSYYNACSIIPKYTDPEVLECSKLKQWILKFKEFYYFLTYCKMQLECAKDSA